MLELGKRNFSLIYPPTFQLKVLPQPITETLLNDGKAPSEKSRETVLQHEQTQKTRQSDDIIDDNFEHPLKIIESNILQLKETSTIHEESLNSITNKIDRSNLCGMTKIEMSELQGKVNTLEKDNSKLLKTLQLQQQSIKCLMELESVINNLKDEIDSVKKSNKNLKAKNKTLSKSINNLEAELSSMKLPKLSAGTQTNTPMATKRISRSTQTNGNAFPCVKNKDTPDPKDKSYEAAIKIPPENITCSPRINDMAATVQQKKSVKNKLLLPKTNSTVPPEAHCEVNTADVPLVSQRSSAEQAPLPPNSGSGTDSCNEDLRGAPTTSEGRVNNSYSKSHCMLVHDGTHNEFDQIKFSSRYIVEHQKISHLSSIAKECDKIITKARESKSEMIFLHAGHQDLWQGDRVQYVTDDFKYLIKELLEKTEAKICISQIIPTGGHYPRFDESAKIVNKTVSSHISDLRASDKYKSRVYTANNDRLQHSVIKSIGDHGIKMKLNSKGYNILWLKLRDGFERMRSTQNRHTYPQKKGLEQHNSEYGRPTYRRDSKFNYSRNVRYND